MAALAVILTALNLVLDLAGTSGFGPEEAIGIGVMVVMLQNSGLFMRLNNLERDR